MKKKKIISLLLVIAMMTWLLPIKIFGTESNSATISVTPYIEGEEVTEATRGSTVDYVFTISAIQDLSNLEFELVIPDELQYQNVTLNIDSSSLGQDGAVSLEETDGQGNPLENKFFQLTSPNMVNFSSETRLMTIRCLVKDNSEPKNLKINIKEQNAGTGLYATSVNLNVSSIGVDVKIPATGVSLDQTSIVLEKGETRQLTAALTPSNSTDSVTWSSNKENIATATVTADEEKACTVTGVDLGIAIIKVVTTSGKEATCEVTVSCTHDNYTYNYEYVDLTNHKKICGNCGEEIVEEHTPKENGKENETPATCVTGGGYDQKYICSFCGCDLQSKHYESLPLDHDYQWTTEREATDDSLGIRKEVCTRCGDERNTEQYLKDGTCPSKDTDGNYISDNKNIPNSSATGSAKVDGQDKELEIIVQDPFGVLGVFELGIKSISEDLGADYDGNISIEKAYMADVNIYQFIGSTPTLHMETPRGRSVDMSSVIDFFSQSGIDASDGKKHIFGDETKDDRYMVIYKGDEIEDPQYYFYEKKSGDLDGKVRLLMEIPDDPYDPNDDWDDYELEIQRLNEGDDTTYYIEAIELRLYDAEGNFKQVVEPGYVPKEGETVKKFSVTWTDHFSKYALIDPKDKADNENKTENNEDNENIKNDEKNINKVTSKSKKTGENLNDVYFAGLLLSAAILAIYLSLKKRKEA